MNVFSILMEDYIDKRIEKLMVDANIPHDIDSVKQYADMFRKYRNPFSLDINSFKTFSELTSKLQEIDTGKLVTKSTVKKQIRQGIPGLTEGTDYIELKLPSTAKPDVRVFFPLTFKGSAAIGRPTKWCTSQENDDHHWKSYTGRGVILFYMFNPSAAQEKNKFIAFAFEKGRLSIFDKPDAHISEAEYERLKTGVPTKFLEAQVKKVEADRDKKFFEAVDGAKTKNQVVTAFTGLSQRKYFSTSGSDAVDINSVNDNLSINYNGGITVEKLWKGKIPLKFHRVDNYFIIQDSELMSLENCPSEVKGDFACIETQISSLIGGPQQIGGNFNINSCKNLVDLNGGPTIVGGDYDVGDTKLNNTNGIATHIGQSLYLNITDTLTITNMPDEIGGDLYLQNSTKKSPEKLKEVAKLFKKVLKGEIYEY